MNLITQLQQAKATQFVALILDNEVTVGEFVTEPPVPWTRIVQQNGTFRVAEGYPSLLTAEQGKFEMKNWDQVSLSGIMRTLGEIGAAIDYYVIGNNAGQGLPLAQARAGNVTCVPSGDNLRGEFTGAERLSAVRLSHFFSPPRNHAALAHACARGGAALGALFHELDPAQRSELSRSMRGAAACLFPNLTVFILAGC